MNKRSQGNLSQSKSVRFFSIICVLISLSIVFELFIAFPILPSAPFLKYSPGDIPLLFIGYYFGPIPGILGSAIKAILFVLLRPDGDGLWGMLMNFLASGTFIGVFSVLSRSKQKKGFLLGLIIGTLSRAGIMIPANLIITPLYMKVSVDIVKTMILPAILPFNLIHSGLNSIFAGVLFPRLRSFFQSKTS